MGGLVSMTGFGRGEARGRGIKVTVELSTVNRKQFDCHVTLPRDLATLEAGLHELIHARVRRGQVKGSVQVAAAPGAARRAAGGLRIDLPRVAAQVAALRRAAASLGLPDDLKASLLLTLPDAVDFAGHPGDPLEVWPLVRQAAERALTALHAMRLREGRALRRDLAGRIRGLSDLQRRIARRAAVLPAAYRATLARRLSEAVGQTIDPAVLARELALFADRCDVREELTRLASHCGQAAQLLRGGEPCGRPLDFLCQEFSREINTTGAKANDARIARLIIRFKTELEALREQVQNVE